jgi:hypothetical protein
MQGTMRSRQEASRLETTVLTFVLLFTGCAHVAIRGSQPEIRRVVHDEHEIEVDAAIVDAAPLLESEQGRGRHVQRVCEWVPDRAMSGR